MNNAGKEVQNVILSCSEKPGKVSGDEQTTNWSMVLVGASGASGR